MATRYFDINNPVSGTTYWDSRWIDPNNGSEFRVRATAYNSSGDALSVYQITAGIDPDPGDPQYYTFSGGAFAETYTTAGTGRYRGGFRWTDGGGYPNPARVRVTITYTGSLINTKPHPPGNLRPSGLTGELQPTMDWSFSDPDSGDSQTAFEVEVYNRATGALMRDSDKRTSTSTSWKYYATNLVRNGTYRFRVRVYDELGAVSDWSTYQDFDVSAAPNPPDYTTFTPTGRINSVQPTISVAYSHPDGLAANGKQFRVYRSDGLLLHESVILAASAANGDNITYPVPVGVLEYGGNYTWQARARDTNNVWSNWSRQSAVAKVNNRPTVSLRTPANNSRANSLTPTMGWSFWDPDNDSQSRYRIYVIRTDTNAVVYDSGYVASAANSATITLPTFGIRYAWQVEVQDSFGQLGSGFTAFWYYTPTDIPSAAISRPVPNEGITTSQYNFGHTYTAGSGGAGQASYQYTFRDATSGAIRHQSALISGTGTSYTPPLGALQNTTAYTVEVMVRDTAGGEGTSPPITFKTLFSAPNDMSPQLLPTGRNFVSSRNPTAPGPYLRHDDNGDGVANDMTALISLSSETSGAFNGSTSHIHVPHAAGLLPASGAKAWTLEAWVRHDANAVESFERVVSKSGFAYDLFVGLDGTLSFVIGVVNADGTLATSGMNSDVGAVAKGAWNHVVATYDGAAATNPGMRVYVNGVLRGFKTETRALRTDSTSALRIGNSPTIAARHFMGLMDMVRVSRVVRYVTTETTLGTAVFTPPRANFASDTNTVALYHMNKTANDSGPGGFHGAANNVAWSPDDDWKTEQFDAAMSITPSPLGGNPMQQVTVTRAQGFATGVRRLAEFRHRINVPAMGATAGTDVISVRVNGYLEGTVNADIFVIFLDAAGVALAGSRDGTDRTDTAGALQTWEELNIPIPTGTETIEVFLRTLASNGQKGNVWWSDFQVELGPTMSPFMVGDMGSGYFFDSSGFSNRKRLDGSAPLTEPDPQNGQVRVTWDPALQDLTTGVSWLRYNVYYRSPMRPNPDEWILLGTETDPTGSQMIHRTAGSGTVYDYGVTQVIQHADGSEVESNSMAIVQGSVFWTGTWFIINLDRPQYREVPNYVVKAPHAWAMEIPTADHQPASRPYVVRDIGMNRGVQGKELEVLYREAEGINLGEKLRVLNRMQLLGDTWAVKDPYGLVFECVIDRVVPETQDLGGDGRVIRATFTFTQNGDGEGLL